MNRTLTAFISYSHDDDIHEKEALRLCNSLRTHGIESEIDQYDPDPSIGWSKWMLKKVHYSDFIIIIFSKLYTEKMFSESKSGVNFESSQLIQLLYENGSKNTNLIVAILKNEDKKFIPNPFSSFTWYDLSSSLGYKKLYSRITGQHKISKPPIGNQFEIIEDTGLPMFDLEADKVNVITEVDAIDIEITINKKFDKYSEMEQLRLMKAIEQLLNLKSNIKIKNIRKGSVKIRFSLSPDKAEELRWKIESGELDYLNVVGLDFLDEESNLGVIGSSFDLPETNHTKEDLFQQIEQLNEVLEQQKDKYLRLFAEFDNFKRRNAKERIELMQTAGKEVIGSLLPILDDYDRIEKVMNESDDINTVKKDGQLIFNKLRNLLKNKGLRVMETLGTEFNPDIHEAVTEKPAPTPQLIGKVIDEVEKGYYLNDRIIRFVKVVVGK